MTPAPKSAPYCRDLQCRPWDDIHAMVIYKELAERFRDSAFILTMHGSVPREGIGNDLDLIAVQWQRTEQSSDGLRDRINARMIGDIGHIFNNIWLDHYQQLDPNRICFKYYYQTIENETRIIDLLAVLL